MLSSPMSTLITVPFTHVRFGSHRVTIVCATSAGEVRRAPGLREIASAIMRSALGMVRNAGLDAVDVDAVRRQLERQLAGVRFKRGFGRRDRPVADDDAVAAGAGH